MADAAVILSRDVTCVHGLRLNLAALSRRFAGGFFSLGLPLTFVANPKLSNASSYHRFDAVHCCNIIIIG